MARHNPVSAIALGGVLAALAVMILCMGTMIPVATFVCPMLCMLLLKVVLTRCGNRISWAWYGAVAILGALLAPDKEAVAVFAFLGFYPIIKPKMETLPAKWLWKVLYFNAAILIMYWLLMHLLGMVQIAEEFAELGTVMTLVTLLLGNVTFYLLDRLLGMRLRFRK
ncbi:MAG: hypothetical protein IJF02_04125 [Oscillospiraceae bacterium]|nr:hypothetical protein [Oscillospiraceae bacterium]